MQIPPTIPIARNSLENVPEVTTSGLYAWLLILKLIPVLIKVKYLGLFDLV